MGYEYQLKWMKRHYSLSIVSIERAKSRDTFAVYGVYKHTYRSVSHNERIYACSAEENQNLVRK